MCTAQMPNSWEINLGNFSNSLEIKGEKAPRRAKLSSQCRNLSRQTITFQQKLVSQYLNKLATASLNPTFDSHRNSCQ